MRTKTLIKWIAFALVVGNLAMGIGPMRPETMSATAETESAAETETERSPYEIPYRFMTQEECAEKLSSLTGYYDGLSQKSLDYFTQKKGATKEEFIEYSKAQALDFTDEEKAAVEESVQFIEAQLEAAGMKLPENVEISYALTTMNEALGAGGYTHETTVFLGRTMIDYYMLINDKDDLNTIIAHELFHCLTRNNPEFRKAMYAIIGFTINDTDFTIPEEVHSQMISNPDVNHHDSWATFTINGEKKDCYLVFLTKDEFEKPGDSFFTGMYTGLVDVNDGTLYDSAEASDFYDVLGSNTDYCEDPEECMATNFSYAVVFGKDGQGGNGYATPSIIEDIIAYMQK